MGPLPCHPGCQPVSQGQGVILALVFLVLPSLHVYQLSAFPPASPCGVRCPAQGEVPRAG